MYLSLSYIVKNDQGDQFQNTKFYTNKKRWSKYTEENEDFPHHKEGIWDLKLITYLSEKRNSMKRHMLGTEQIAQLVKCLLC